MINKKDLIFLTGHNGLVGSSILKLLKKKNFKNIVTIEKKKLDLRDQKSVLNFFSKHKFKAVIHAAAKVGGILANDKYKAEFIYDNIVMQNNVIHYSCKNNVKDLIFLGSSCIYPKLSRQPIKENYLLSGKLEPTNESYAIAKIAGIKMCESYNYQFNTNFKCLMPCNLYGSNDNFDLKNSHFYPALINKIYNAKIKNINEIYLWGKKNTLRELMHVDDLADACIFFLNKKTKETLINIGSGLEMTIFEYAKFIMKKLDVKLNIKFDKSMPSGTPRKIVDTKLASSYGWKPKISLDKGFDDVLDGLIKYQKKNF